MGSVLIIAPSIREGRPPYQTGFPTAFPAGFATGFPLGYQVRFPTSFPSFPIGKKARAATEVAALLLSAPDLELNLVACGDVDSFRYRSDAATDRVGQELE